MSNANRPNINILAVSGFLGSGSDWDQVKNHLQNKSHFNWITPSLFSPTCNLDLSQGFDVLSKQLYELVPKTGLNIFIGYSLGARLGLHLLEKFPEFFQHFIFISGHPGLENQQQKDQRLQLDQVWSQKLIDLSWTEFVDQWAQQPVFAADKSIVRLQRDYDRDKLMCAFTKLSLGQQENKNLTLHKFESRTTWIVGDQDAKFLQLAEDLKQKKILSGYERILNSGHRVLFNQPSRLAEIIESLNNRNL